MLLALAFAVVSPAPAQGARRVTARTEFAADPNGTVLATLMAGTALRPTGTRKGDWTEARLEGWIFSASTAATSRDGFDLRVSADAGENLRAEPNGDILARARTGMLLNRLEKRGAWVRVSRTGWVRSSALPAPPAPQTAQRPSTDTLRQTREGADGGRTPAPADTGDSGAERVETTQKTGLRATPDGPPVAMLEKGASARVLSRSGGWTRVQLEGWVRDSDVRASTNDVLVGVSADEIRADPERYVGRTVEWRLQFISLQVADELRPEIPAGQPYLLTRGPLPGAGFVYVMIDPRSAAQFEGLRPLQELTVRAVVRAARTRYLATPVVQLVRVMPPPGG